MFSCDKTFAEQLEKLRQSTKPSRVRTVAAADSVLAVIAAQPGAAATPTACFAVLLRAVLRDDDDAAAAQQSVGPMLRLLAMLLPAVPQPVLRAHLPPLARSLAETLRSPASAAAVACAAAALAQMQRMLPPPPPPDAAAKPLAAALVSAALQPTQAKSASEKAKKCQRAAAWGVESLLKAAAGQETATAAAVHAACARALQRAEPAPALALLEQAGACLPPSNRQTLAGTIAALARRLAAKSGGTDTALLALRALASVGGAQALASAEGITPDTPNVFCAYTAALATAIATLREESPSDAAALLPALVPRLCSALVASAAARLRDCAQAAAHVLREAVRSVSADTAPVVARAILALLVPDPSAEAEAAAWEYSLGIAVALLRGAGRENSGRLFGSVVSAICDLHSAAPQTLLSQIEAAAGGALEAVGATQFLSCVPLNLDDPDAARDWLLPVLLAHMTDAPLSLFASQFMPVAEKLHAASEQSRETSPVQARNLWNRHMQLWDLLPGCCKVIDDIVSFTTSFKRLAPKLGTALKDTNHAAPVCLAIRALVTAAQEKPDVQTLLGAYAKNFLPCLFNALHNAAEHPRRRQQVLAAIEAYLSVSPKQIVSQHFRTIVSQLLDATTEASKHKDSDDMETDAAASKVQTAVTMLHLAAAFVPYIDSEAGQLLLKTVEPFLPSTSKADIRIRKRSWGVVRAMCSKTAATHHVELGKMLSETETDTASRRPWVKCAISLAKEAPPQWIVSKFAIIALPHIILFAKDPNSRTRDIALRAIDEFGAAFKASGIDLAADAFASAVLAGLGAKSAHMVSATIVALAKILYDAPAGPLTDGFVVGLLDAIILLLRAESAEVVRTVIQFLKTALSALDTAALEPHLRTILTDLIAWNKSHPKCARKESRHLYERLLRKFGFGKVSAFVPEDSKRILTNIRKRKARQKKRKEAAERKAAEATTKKPRPTFSQTLDLSDLDTDDEGGVDDEDDGADGSEEEIVDEGQATPGKRRRRGFEEDDDDDDDEMRDDFEDEMGSGVEEPMDLADPAAVVGRISSTKQRSALPAKKRKPSDIGVTFDAEGRIVVPNEDAVASTRAPAAKKGEGDVEEREEEGAGEDEEESSKAKEDKRSQQAAKQGRSAMYERMLQRRVQREEERRRGKPNPNRHSGEEFRGRGRGDVKRGEVEPFAYLPLDPRTIKKKGRARAQSDFKSVVGAAKRGSAAGKGFGKSHKQRKQRKHA